MNLYSYAFILTLVSIVTALTKIDIEYAVVALLSGAVSAIITKSLMPKMKELMMKKNICGLDLNKKGS